MIRFNNEIIDPCDERIPRIVMQGRLNQAVDVSPSRGNPNPPKRGKVKGFSKASRRRMIKTCARLGNAVPIFLTLTYGKRYPSDPKQWKRHLDTFGKRLVRYNPNLSAIWRLEPQKRGAPHYHLLIYQSNGKAPFVPKKWIAKAWSEVLGSYSDSKHLVAGTRIESLDSSRGAAFYVSKYCAKLPEDDDFPEEWKKAGRLWGIINKKSVPFADKYEMLLHSEKENHATLFAFKDLSKSSFLSKKAKSYEDSGVSKKYSLGLAVEDWKQRVDGNKHFGNTTTFFGSADRLIKEMSHKLCFLEGKHNASRGLASLKAIATRYAACLVVV